MKAPRIVLSGSASGVGKTSVTCAIIHGLRKRGYSVQPFKVGPDYIDPSYLSAVSGNQAHNLDVWLMGTRELTSSFVRRSNSDISVIEGVMGHYDGFSGKDNRASTHHVASLTRSNVILVLDAAKAARSVAATALGFVRFHKNSRISGIILNKIGSKRHEDLCRDALSGLKIPVVGAVPKNPGLSLESRHLGLVPAGEDGRLRSRILKTARAIAEFLDFDQIVRIAKDSQPLPRTMMMMTPEARAKRRACTIAVALDGSFNFYYPANLDALRREGAGIRFFSPVSDKKLPACDGIYIGGGFPEVLSKPLSRNSPIKNSIKKSIEGGVPLYAECGGLMYLTKSIRDGGQRFPMIGFIDAETVMTKKMKLGYTKSEITSRCILSDPPAMFHGHEFHYSELDSIAKDTKFAYRLSIGHGIAGHCDGITANNVLASYGHLFFDGKNFARNFVSACVAATAAAGGASR